MKSIVFCAALAGVLASFQAQAVPFQNGDFSNGSTAWNVLTDTASPGQVIFNTGSVDLQTGTDAAPYSAGLIQGDDGTLISPFTAPFTLGPLVQSLVFQASFARTATNPAETPVDPLVRDYVSVTVYDANSADLLQMLDPGIDSTLTGLGTFTLDVSAFRGRDVALEFDLTNQNDGWFSTATLQNIHFVDASANAVPEPYTLALFGAGLLGMAAQRRRRC